MVMDMSSTCACKERVEVARGQGGSVGSKATISLAVLALAQLGVSADNGAFSVAMSEMMSVFGCSVADVQLANTVYALMAGTFMLASGLLGLMVGWRRTFVGGMVLMVIGEIVTALAPVVELLIWGGRLAVGVGASLVIPSVLGMVPLLFEGDKRKQAYGVIAGSAALATIVPIPLGMLVDNFGFRFTFGALVAYFGALVAASLALPASQPRASKKFDLVGAALASMGLFAVMFGLSRISAWGVADPLPTAPFTIFGLSPAPLIVIAGVALLIVLIPVESWMERARRRHPALQLHQERAGSLRCRGDCAAVFLHGRTRPGGHVLLPTRGRPRRYQHGAFGHRFGRADARARHGHPPQVPPGEFLARGAMRLHRHRPRCDYGGLWRAGLRVDFHNGARHVVGRNRRWYGELAVEQPRRLRRPRA